MCGIYLSLRLLLITATIILVKGQGNVTEAGGRVTLECEGSKMKATVNTTLLFGGFDTGRPVALSLTTCNESKYTVIENTIETDFYNCSYNITQTKDIIIQEAKLIVEVSSNQTSSIITRSKTIVFMLRCSFDRRLNVSSAEGAEVDADSSQVFTKRGDTNFTAEMNFYISDAFDTKASSPLQVTDFEPIYMQITALKNQQLFKFIVEECYATPSANPLDPTKYMYFGDKCRLDDTLKTYPQQSGHNKFSHSIQAFRFIQVKNQVFFHCRLLICKNSTTTDECTQKCKLTKRKRRAAEDGAVEQLYVNSGMVKYTKKASCKDTACPINSRCYELHPAVCRCDDGYVLSWESKTCIKEYVVTLENLHLDEKFIPSYSISTSPDFIRLARLVEQQLMTSYSIQRDVIKGVKMIGAREGSVIVDLQLLHSETVTPQQAFHSFIKSVVQSGANMNVLRIKTHITPVLVGVEYNSVQLSSNVITIVVVVLPIVCLMLALSVFLFFKRRKAGKMEVESVPSSYDNKGAQINNMS